MNTAYELANESLRLHAQILTLNAKAMVASGAATKEYERMVRGLEDRRREIIRLLPWATQYNY